MSSPCQAGYTQMLNDWYDREIDAINEPYRPIPSGAISENEEASLLKFFPSGDYPNLGTAFGRPWVGWFIGCVGRAGNCFREILSILHLLSSTFEGNSANKTGHASLVSIR